MLSPLSTLCFGGKCAESGYLCDSNKTFLIDAAQAKDLEKTAIQIKRTEATMVFSNVRVRNNLYREKIWTDTIIFLIESYYSFTLWKNVYWWISATRFIFLKIVNRSAQQRDF